MGGVLAPPLPALRFLRRRVRAGALHHLAHDVSGRLVEELNSTPPLVTGQQVGDMLDQLTCRPAESRGSQARAAGQRVQPGETPRKVASAAGIKSVGRWTWKGAKFWS